MNVDWRSIRPLNGGRDKWFEELCSQLAQSEVAGRARFIRKGNPDAGVEVAPVSRTAWRFIKVYSGCRSYRQIPTGGSLW